MKRHIFLDVDVLASSIDLRDPRRAKSAGVVGSAAANSFIGYVSFQVLWEVHLLLTNSELTAVPMNFGDADHAIRIFLREPSLKKIGLPDDLQTFDSILRMLRPRRYVDTDILVARIVQTMRHHDITWVCTYRDGAFSGYKGIVSLTPEDPRIPTA